ncbi:NUDIX hydrolase [Salinibacterium sp. G-O1]|uniref:NUDIX domain-containing protein n=1 Tax=Salinibacterium sp. G-O1 TaxID=3046208 RepID=UPI0024BACBCB|nr:NUDIX hydrolase [Salinibacterium sp. G-O1]MDJ0334855.1 NUDIX hydrolase [Salinibacterium sp. G-O1]
MRDTESAPAGLSDDAVEPVVLSSDVTFDGKVWDIRREVFELDGHEVTREFMDHPGAVAVLLLDDDDRVLVIKQYRHPVRSRDWELPAGLLDIAGESPLLAAQRELAEEVDKVADRWDLLADFMTSPGGSNEVLRVYLARGVSEAPEVFERTEEEAGIEVRWVPLDDLVDAVLARDIQNSILVIAVLAAAAGRARGWSTLGDAEAPMSRHPLERSLR